MQTATFVITPEMLLRGSRAERTTRLGVYEDELIFYPFEDVLELLCEALEVELSRSQKRALIEQANRLL